MAIKEQDSQHIVIAPPLRTEFWGLVFLVLVFGVGTGFSLSKIWGIVILVLGALHIFGRIIGNRTVVDKRTETITVEKRYLFFIRRKHVIPFSRVALSSVTVEHELEAQGPGRCVVSFIYGVPGVGVKKFKIDEGTHWDMQHLASELSKLMGK